MRQPPPGTIESIAEDISSSVSQQRPLRSSTLEECQQRSFLTASAACFVAFSAGLATQVELTRFLPPRFRVLTQIIPISFASVASVGTFRVLSDRCSRRLGHMTPGRETSRSRAGGLQRRHASEGSSDSSITSTSVITCSQATSPAGDSQHFFWNQNSDLQGSTHNPVPSHHYDHSAHEAPTNIIPVLP